MDDRRALSISNKNGLEIGISTESDSFCHQLSGASQGQRPSRLNVRKVYTRSVPYEVPIQLNMKEVQHLLSWDVRRQSSFVGSMRAFHTHMLYYPAVLTPEEIGRAHV